MKGKWTGDSAGAILQCRANKTRTCELKFIILKLGSGDGEDGDVAVVAALHNCSSQLGVQKLLETQLLLLSGRQGF